MTTMSPGAVVVRLAQIRAERGLTQEKLAEMCNVTRQTIIGLERGNFAAIERLTIEKISDALGSMDWLEYVPENKVS